MDQKQLAQAIGKPQVARLKQVASGIRVGQVMGSRILVNTVVAKTALDDSEQKGLLVIPEWVKKDNTPMPTTGFVVMVGPNVPCSRCGEGALSECHSYNEHYLYHSHQPILKEGDMVLFPKFSGSDFNIEELTLRILEAREVMCTLEDVDPEGSVEELNG